MELSQSPPSHAIYVNPDFSYTFVWGKTYAIIPYFQPLNSTDWYRLKTSTKNRLPCSVMSGGVTFTSSDGSLFIGYDGGFVTVDNIVDSIGIIQLLPYQYYKPVTKITIQMTVTNNIVYVSSIDTPKIYGGITVSELYAIMNYIHKGVIDESTSYICVDEFNNIIVRDLLIPCDLRKTFRKVGYALFQKIHKNPISNNMINKSFDKIQKKLDKLDKNSAEWTKVTKNKAKSKTLPVQQSQ